MNETLKLDHPQGTLRRSLTLVVVPVAVLLLLLAGLAITLQPRGGGFPDLKQALPPSIELQRQQAEIAQRFQQGVVMLHAKKYEYALTSFKRVIELAPDMPEAQVNMGFALLGLEQYQAAAEFFDRATALRSDQINAYWGLAHSLEALGNLRGAVEAMQAFAHLAKPGDPFRAKALETIGTWEAKVQAQYAAPPVAAKTPGARGKAKAAPPSNEATGERPQ